MIALENVPIPETPKPADMTANHVARLNGLYWYNESLAEYLEKTVASSLQAGHFLHYYGCFDHICLTMTYKNGFYILTLYNPEMDKPFVVRNPRLSILLGIVPVELDHFVLISKESYDTFVIRQHEKES